VVHTANDANRLSGPPPDGSPGNPKSGRFSLRLSLGIWLVGSVAGWAAVYLLVTRVLGF